MKLTNEKGITIISLVVTIIVMLILAGVTVGMVNKENNSTNGLITQVEKHVDNQQQMIEQEKDKMNQTLKNQEKDWGLTD